MLIDDGSLVHPACTVWNTRPGLLLSASHCRSPICNMWQIHQSLSPSMLQTLVAALVLSWLHYVNSVLDGLPAHLTKCLQSVLNADGLMMLHWLRIPKCIKFRLAVLVHGFCRAMHRAVSDHLFSCLICWVDHLWDEHHHTISLSCQYDCRCKGVSSVWANCMEQLTDRCHFYQQSVCLHSCLKNFPFHHSYSIT